jgi:hypothetical protein
MPFARMPCAVLAVGVAALLGFLAAPVRAATTTYDTNNTPYAGGYKYRRPRHALLRVGGDAADLVGDRDTPCRR